MNLKKQATLLSLKWLGIILVMAGFLQPASGQQDIYPDWDIEITHGTVHKLAIAKGYIWAATEGGLIRVDTFNNSTKFFNTANSLLRVNEIKDLAVDGSDNIWLATEGSGLCYFDGSDFEVFTDFIPGSSISSFTSVAVDANDNVWAIGGSGIVKWNGSDWNLFTASDIGASIAYSSSIDIDQGGNPWFLSCNKLIQYDGSNFTVHNQNLTSNCFKGFDIDLQDDIWLAAGEDGVVVYDGSSWVIEDAGLSSGTDVTYIGAGMVGTESGKLYEFDGVEWVNTFQGSGYYINDVLIHDSYIWEASRIGLYRDGLSVNIASSSIPSNDIDALAVDGTDVWTVINGDLYKFDGMSWTNYDPNDWGFSGSIEDALFVDDNGHKWMIVSNNLVEFDNTDFINHCNLPMLDPTVIISDGQGGLWIGSNTNDRALHHYDGTNCTLYSNSNSDIPPSTQVYDLALDKSGDLWLATNRLMRFNGSNWTVFDHYYHKNLPESLAYVPDSVELTGGLRNIEISPDGSVWGTARSKILKYDGNKLFRENKLDDAREYYDFKIDASGSLWIPTANSLIKYDGDFGVLSSSYTGYPYPGFAGHISIDINNNKWMIGQRVDFGLTVFKGSWATSINETKDLSLQIQIYPNPNNGNFTIDLGSIRQAYVRITALNGRELLRKQISGQGQHHFSLRQQAAGLYFVEVVTKEGKEVLKVVKE